MKEKKYAKHAIRISAKPAVRVAILAALAACAALPGRTSRADLVSEYWIGGDGSWSDPGNWSLGIVPGSTSDTFDVSIATQDPVTIDMTTTASLNLLAISGPDVLAFSDGGSINTSIFALFAGTVMLDPTSANSLAATSDFIWTGGTLEYTNFTLPSPLTLQQGMSLDVANTFTLAAPEVLNISGGFMQVNGLQLSSGTLSLTNVNSLLIDNGSFVNTGAHFVWTAGTLEFPNFTPLVGMTIQPQTALVVSNTLTLSSPVNLSVSGGSLTAGYLRIAGGTLSLNNASSIVSVYNSFSLTSGQFLWTAGTLSLGGDLSLQSSNIGSNPTLNANQSLVVGGNLYLANSNRLTINGGSISVYNSEIMGDGTTSFCTQTGGVNNVSDYLWLGTNFSVPGAATYTLSGGTISAFSEYLGYGSGAVGTMSQRGGVNNISGYLSIGSNGGSGTYSLSNLGTLSASDIDVSNGTFFLASGKLFAYSLSVEATFNQVAGTNSANYLYVDSQTGVPASYNLSNGTLTPYYESIGESGSGTWNQSGGVNNVNGSIVFGYYYGSSGMGTITGGSLTAYYGQVGLFGTGSFYQSGGTVNFSDALAIGSSYDSSGSGLYSLSGGALTCPGLSIYQGNPDAPALFQQTGGTSSLGYIQGTGTLSVTGGTATAQNINLQTVMLGGTGRLLLAPGDGSIAASFLNNLSFSESDGNWSGQLELSNNSLIIECTDSKASEIALLQDQVNSGKNGGTWDGQGITCSAVAADAAAGTNNSFHTVLAIFDNGAFPADAALFTFDGQYLDANSIIITRALAGDSNLDGTVDNTDLVALLTHYGLAGQTQATGDYNGDGTVNNTDLVALLTDYGQSLPAGLDIVPAESTGVGAPVPAPEPGMLAFFGTGVLLLPYRRRRRASTARGPDSP